MNAFIHYVPGVWVMHDGEHYVITHNTDLEKVLIKHSETGKLKEVSIASLSPISGEKEGKPRLKGTELSQIDTEKWREAEEWSDKLRPLLETSESIYLDVQEIARKSDVHVSTIYRKLKLLKNVGKISALVRDSPSGGKGKSRLSEESEYIIQQVINELYFNKEKKKRSKTEIYEEIEVRLNKAGFAVPSQKTVFNRINQAVKKRESSKQFFVPDTYDDTPVPGKIPGANYPLAIVQIDHTPVDINVVDDETRQSIGKPWITLLIDVYSRIILGFCKAPKITPI